MAQENHRRRTKAATADEAIVVCVRVRPSDSDLIGVKCQSNHKNIEIDNDDQQVTFSCSRVFGPESPQGSVFAFCGVKELIRSVLQGFNSTVFTYGHTGLSYYFLFRQLVPRA
jgi:hypothetical protein